MYPVNEPGTNINFQSMCRMFLMLGCRVSNSLKNQQPKKLFSNRIPTNIPYSTALENDKNKSNESFETTDEEGFRQLDIPGLNVVKEKKVRVKQRTQVPPPRHISMKVDQDWTNVWPAASTFKWSAVPFPVRQGLIKNKTQNEGVPPGRYANAELMKIPNFLHLTPAHIKKHCAVLKKFCSPWPQGLDTDKKCKHHFPVTIKSSDYLRSSPSIRDPRARIVDLKIKLSSLALDYHARDKIIRLSGNNYDKKTDTLTLEGARCPLKIQNEEYVKYLLSALYFESRKKEPWEKFKEEIDWEKYFWDLAASKGNLLILVKNMKQTLFQAGTSNENTPDFIKTLPADFNEEQLINTETVQQYKSATTELHNEGENIKTLTQYKDSVVNLIHGTPFS